MLHKAGAVLLTASLLIGGMAAGSEGTEAKTKVKSFQAAASKKTLYLGWTKSKKTASIKLKVKPKKALKAALFRSSNKKIASVSKKGKVTAHKAGRVTITVTSKANRKLKRKIKFTVKNYPMKFSKKKVYITLEGKSDITEKKLTLYGINGSVTYKSDNAGVASVTKAGKVKAKKLGTAVITAKNKKGKKASCTVVVERTNQAIHDPSVYRDPQSGKYYSFGSHLTAAVSTNLVGWSAAANCYGNYSSSASLFTKKYTKEFAEAYAYTMPDGASQNAWAPDIIYNTDMKKYCMYMSIVDGTKKCCIAMAVSDKPDGPYSYRGMIVCSGMNTDGSDLAKTNVAAALGMTDAQAAESKYATLGDNSPDCIDATVFYDHDGNLWMVYGSFTTTGGIRLLKLDKATGLRGTNYADSGDGTDQTLSTDDPYYGKKIANSNGEGPYIQMVANKNSSTGYYYYLWTSVGNLQYYGGYNMRVVRAEKPEGPYYDPKGNEATKDLQKYALGLRVMDNYQFSFMDTAFVSQGGNSATDDGKGKTFIQFHARTSSSDNFTFRTHQTFMNEDGWLVTAPYEYNGETIASQYEKSAVVGDYEFLYHRDAFAKTTTATKDILKSVRVTLHDDGTISGAYEGTWTINGHYITLKFNGKTYKGVVLEQYEQTEEREKVMVFTAVGSDNRAVWGSKMHKSNAAAVSYDTKNLSVPENAPEDFSLVTEGLFGSRITWSSNNGAIKISDGTAEVNGGTKAAAVTLTATVVKGSSQKTKTFTVKVPETPLTIDTAVSTDTLALPATYDGERVTWTSSDPSIISADGKVTPPASGYRKVTMTASYQTASHETAPYQTQKKEFEVVVMPEKFGENIYEEDYSAMVSDTAIATRWSSSRPSCLYVEADETHDSFIKFAAGNTQSSKGAWTLFDMDSKAKDCYAVTFDVALEAGTADTTEFALIGTDVKYRDDNADAGLDRGYIFKLSAKNSTQWSINDSGKTFGMPTGWVSVTAVVDSKTKKAAVMIADENHQYYGGEVTVNGNGRPGGLYLHWACKQSLVSVDNVKVYNNI